MQYELKKKNLKNKLKADLNDNEIKENNIRQQNPSTKKIAHNSPRKSVDQNEHHQKYT